MIGVRVISGGRTTLPKAVLDGLGAKPGDTLVWTIAGDGVQIERLPETKRRP